MDRIITVGDTGIVLLVSFGGAGKLVSGLLRGVCPFCSQSDCERSCDGSTWNDDDLTADELSMRETDEDVHERLLGNRGLDAVESLVLAHACAGVDVEAAGYVTGVRTALDALSDN